ncbi:MAG TPA: hypothetical protein VMD91_19020 [Candidatus Sulfotelmatobacter sp.]|nr:hypothetical protein [Candidatus Sulfotelmatobacter sp.]
MNALRGVGFCVVLGLSLAGCGGSRALPAPAKSASAHQRMPVTIEIDVPKASAAAARRARYVSPATTQMTIDVQTGCPGSCADVSGYPTTVGLTPTSNGCTSTLASTSCELAIALTPGSYTLALTTADASGTTLSSAQQIAFTVVVGQANSVSLTLSGVPTAITATMPTASSPDIYVATVDADGNYIVGPGAPTFTVAQTGGAGGVLLTQPTATSTNEFVAKPWGAGTTALQVTAAFSGTNTCALPGAVCTANFTYTATIASQTLVVPSYAPAVQLFAPPYTGAAETAFSAGIGPMAIAVDPLGNIYVANGFDEDTVRKIAPPYTGTAETLINADAQWRGLAFDANGNLYVTDTNGFGRWLPPYQESDFQALDPSVNAGQGITFDASGNLWVATGYGGTVNEYAAPYTGSAALTLVHGTYPQDVAFDSKGDLFVFDQDSDDGLGYVREYASPYTGAAVLSLGPFNYGYQGGGVALDTADNLYIANGDDNADGGMAIYAPPYTGSATYSYFAGIPGRIRFLNTYTTSIAPS